MTTTQIVLDPALHISPQAFAAAWNADQDHHAIAEASLQPLPGRQFDPSLAEAAIVVLTGLASGVAGNALYDLIKELLLHQGVTKRTQITTLEQPDGTKLTVITAEEDA